MVRTQPPTGSTTYGHDNTNSYDTAIYSKDTTTSGQDITNG